MLIESIKKEIIENLRVIDPVKVILFGSYAYGTPDKDSVIDLYIVTKDNSTPETFEDNLQTKNEVNMAISNIKNKYASNILVHTLSLHLKFIELESSFSQEIMQKGIVLI